jgi:anti-sigma factor RsiW
MTKTFTQNDLIRYIYDETSHEESIEIQKALLCDNALHEEHKRLSTTVRLLDELLEPGTASSVASSRSKV